jgi:hypothetical protein
MDDNLRKLAEAAAKPEEIKKTRGEFTARLEKIDRETAEKVERVKRG